MKPRTQLLLEEMGYSNIHFPEKCGNDGPVLTGERCMVHNPSDHHMRGWPINLRLDKGGPAERQCPHGIGHPDPDSLSFVSQLPGRGQYAGVHGCDGCCSR